MAENFVLPDLGEGIHEAQIIQILIKEGDTVSADQPLMEVETDKAAVEIPSPHSGQVSKIHVSTGQTVKVGSVLVTFGDAGTSRPSAAVLQAVPVSAPSKPATVASAAQPTPAQGIGTPSKVAASPVVRRLAKEKGIDLEKVPGSGPGGRVTREDLERFSSGGRAVAAASPGPRVEPASASAPVSVSPKSMVMPEQTELPDFTKYGSIRREPMTQIRKTIAGQMARSQMYNVHVTHNDMVDIQMLEQLRKDHNSRLNEGDTKLTLMPFVIKAVQAAMRRYPIFNASYDRQNQEIIYKEYYHFGVAVDTPRGLVVPVIRDVDKKSIRELAIELSGVGQKARDTSFKIDELRGGTFTITNIGSLGGLVSTPIINYPEVAILGLGKADMRPVVREGQVVARYMMPVNLSFDHQVIDGADAARFCGELIRYLEVPGRLLLEE